MESNGIKWTVTGTQMQHQLIENLVKLLVSVVTYIKKLNYSYFSKCNSLLSIPAETFKYF